MIAKLIENNKKARHDYFFEEIIECGLVLTGTEIKSVRKGGISLRDSFAKVDNGEIFAYNVKISPYEQGNRYNTEPMRPKKLLLHKKEIRKIREKLQQQGMTLVPLTMYINEDGRAKMEIATAKGKKLYDKRQDIAKRDASRKMQRAMKKEKGVWE